MNIHSRSQYTSFSPSFVGAFPALRFVRSCRWWLFVLFAFVVPVFVPVVVWCRSFVFVGVVPSFVLFLSFTFPLFRNYEYLSLRVRVWCLAFLRWCLLTFPHLPMIMIFFSFPVVRWCPVDIGSSSFFRVQDHSIHSSSFYISQRKTNAFFSCLRSCRSCRQKIDVLKNLKIMQNKA